MSAVLIFAVGLLPSSVAQTTPIYYACVNNSSGTIHVVSGSAKCSSNEVLISWNEVGPKGDTGPAGPVNVFNIAAAGTRRTQPFVRGTTVNLTEPIDLPALDVSGNMIVGTVTANIYYFTGQQSVVRVFLCAPNGAGGWESLFPNYEPFVQRTLVWPSLFDGAASESMTLSFSIPYPPANKIAVCAYNLNGPPSNNFLTDMAAALGANGWFMIVPHSTSTVPSVTTNP